MKSGKIILGVLAGIAIGALAGILFAPNSGERTRKKITDKGDDFADLLKDKTEEYLETLKSKYDLLKKEVKDKV